MNYDKLILKEVEESLNEILKRNISQTELEALLTKLYLIMENQVQIYLYQYETTTNFLPIQSPNNIISSPIPFNYIQNVQQNLIMTPYLYPNLYQNHFNLQPTLTATKHPGRVHSSTKNKDKTTKKHQKSRDTEKHSKHVKKESRKVKKEGKKARKDKKKEVKWAITKDGQILIQYDSEHPFNGIISYLKKQPGQNIFDAIEVTSSSTLGNYIPINIIYDENEKNDEKSFWSRDIPDSWISIHFKTHKIIPTGYLIHKKPGFSIPISWVIEASNDNQNWEIIDKQNDCKELSSKNYLTFEIKNKKSFSSIRVKMIEQNSNGCYVLIIQTFEVYGTLIPN